MRTSWGLKKKSKTLKKVNNKLNIMMRKSFLLLLFGICNYAVFAQSSKYFNKRWGQASPVYDGATNVLQLPDSTYFITTATNTQIANTVVKNVFKIKKDSQIYSQTSDSDLTFFRSISQNFILEVTTEL
jgi:hypothetical protein